MVARTQFPIADSGLETVTRKLFGYCKSNNWSGHDPYDALNSEILRLFPILDSRVPRIALTQFLKRSPVDFRRFLRIPPTQNPKALGIFLKAALKLQSCGLLEDGSVVEGLAEKVLSARSSGVEHFAWGYSFP